MIEHQDCYWPCPAVVRPGSSPLCVWMGRVFFEWEHNIPDAAPPLFTRPSALPDLNTCRCYYTRYEQRTAVNTFVVVVMKALTTCQSHVASCTATLLGVRRCEDGCRPSTPWSTCVSTHSPTLTFSMNGDMPHVPITTLAGIASLTDCEWHTVPTRYHSLFTIAPLVWNDLSEYMETVSSIWSFLSLCVALLLMLFSPSPVISLPLQRCPFRRLPGLITVLNQLPLPSPLPATTTKSLLYNGRVAEEVTCLLGCRDENLASQLAHSLNQVSTEHMWVVYIGTCL